MELGFTFLIFIIAIYFIPAVIASSRKHKNGAAIIALNIFLGWTMLGWVIALVWAFTNNVENATVAN